MFDKKILQSGKEKHHQKCIHFNFSSPENVPRLRHVVANRRGHLACLMAVLWHRIMSTRKIKCKTRKRYFLLLHIFTKKNQKNQFTILKKWRQEHKSKILTRIFILKHREHKTYVTQKHSHLSDNQKNRHLNNIVVINK